MRNLMIVSLALYIAVWWLLRPLGNTGLWLAILIYFGARGVLQAARYPALARGTFKPAIAPQLRPRHPAPRRRPKTRAVRFG